MHRQVELRRHLTPLNLPRDLLPPLRRLAPVGEVHRAASLGHVPTPSQETGAMLLYHGQTVSLLWQSKQARSASARVSVESHDGSCATGGLV